MSTKLVVCALLAGVLAGDVYGSAAPAMCICPLRVIADEFKRSDVVFVGTAVSGDVERVVLKVDRLWKGSLPPLATLLNLTKSLPSGDTFFTGCDYRIATDAPVVIFAMRGATGDLSTGVCTLNRPASDTTLIDSLNKLAKPYPPKASR
jgi:hypothetical protein